MVNIRVHFNDDTYKDMTWKEFREFRKEQAIRVLRKRLYKWTYVLVDRPRGAAYLRGDLVKFTDDAIFLKHGIYGIQEIKMDDVIKVCDY